MLRFTAREMEEKDAPKEETLSDYLQEYESKSWKIKEHLSFQEFCQIKEERRSSNTIEEEEADYFCQILMDPPHA